MIIMNQAKTAIYNFDDISKVYVSSTGIQAETRTRNGGQLGKYRNQETCSFVLQMMASAVQDGEALFEFPSEQEMEHAKQHRSHVKVKENRHGGS